jgi:hypothetical protein
MYRHLRAPLEASWHHQIGRGILAGNCHALNRVSSPPFPHATATYSQASGAGIVTAGRLSTYERQLLRERAVASWQRSDELAWQAEFVRRKSEALMTQSARLLARPRAVMPLTYLIRRAIETWDDPIGGTRILDQGVALVASAHMGQLLRIKELLGAHVSYVVGATDAGTTLGLAIAAQPDIAVFDTELELGSGVDVALMLPTYSPNTNALVLTDDPGQAGDVRVVGLDADVRSVSNAALLAWAGATAA